jgi:hypothetical protein
MQPAREKTAAQRPCGSPTRKPNPRKPEPPAPTSRTPPFTTTQFHVLLNSLFKVLFNFPSRYLFAIGLGVIFSLTWSLPRTLSCTPKQLDSREKVSAARQPPYGPITLYGPWPQSRWTWTGRTSLRGDSPEHHIPRDREGRRFGAGLCPFHSPLLRASQLFSFPPLINMLKFGG